MLVFALPAAFVFAFLAMNRGKILKEKEGKKLSRSCLPTSDARAKMGRLSRELKPNLCSAV